MAQFRSVWLATNLNHAQFKLEVFGHLSDREVDSTQVLNALETYKAQRFWPQRTTRPDGHVLFCQFGFEIWLSTPESSAATFAGLVHAGSSGLLGQAQPQSATNGLCTAEQPPWSSKPALTWKPNPLAAQFVYGPGNVALAAAEAEQKQSDFETYIHQLVDESPRSEPPATGSARAGTRSSTHGIWASWFQPEDNWASLDLPQITIPKKQSRFFPSKKENSSPASSSSNFNESDGNTSDCSCERRCIHRMQRDNFSDDGLHDYTSDRSCTQSPCAHHIQKCLGSDLMQEIFDIDCDALSLGVPPLPDILSTQVSPTTRDNTISDLEDEDKLLGTLDSFFPPPVGCTEMSKLIW